MQPPDSLVALMAYAFVMSVTPGPNNVLLLASGLRFGLRRTSGHMAGILAGTLAMIGFIGAGLGALFAHEPFAQTLLKLAGSVYMLWLARQLWRSSAVRMTALTQPIGFRDAAVFQFVNPKVWLMATSVIAVFVPAGAHYAERVASAALVFGAVALPCIALWAASGDVLRRCIHNPVALRRINRTLALLAAATLLLFWL